MKYPDDGGRPNAPRKTDDSGCRRASDDNHAIPGAENTPGPTRTGSNGIRSAGLYPIKLRGQEVASEYIEWLPIPSQPGYEVSNAGEVRNAKTGRVRKLQRGPDGYLRTNFKGPKFPIPHRVHVLVAEAFIGDRPDGMCIDHLDGNKTNNHATNLEYVTIGENNRRANAMGLCKENQARGERQGLSKLTADEVREIVKLFPVASNSEIGDIYGVNQATVWMIRKGRTWSHVTGITEGGAQ